MRTFSTLLVLFVLSGCNPQQLASLLDREDDLIYTGLDMQGNERSCKKMQMGLACTMIYGPGDKFADDCEASGDIAIQCDCHDFICVSSGRETMVTGKDMDGDDRSCEGIPSDTACTTEFTPGDQFAIDCVDDGGTAFQCACHDFICLK